MFKKLVAAFCLAALVLTVGCSSNNTPDIPDVTVDNGNNSESKEKDNNKQNTENTDINNDTQQKPDEEIMEDSPFKNSLTGLGCTEEVSKNRPIAVMINNLKQAMPQVGVENADIVYEVLEEGGITRLMCLFKDYENIPELGSIRSSRDYYIDLSDAHDALYVHCGGSTYAKDMLAQRKTNNIDGLYDAQFYRSAERRKTMAYEHTLMISGEGIKEVANRKKYRTSSEAEQPLSFSKEYNMESARSAVNIKIPFSLALQSNPYALSTFEYDNESGKYLKSQYGQKHIDGATGNQLCFTNVITLECNQNVIPGDELGCLAVHFTGQGKGLYAVDGKIKPIVWKKASRTTAYTLYEADGVTPLELKPGKSYIGIVPTGTKVSYN